MNATRNTFKRIAINTGGGDAPGLNAVIHAAVHAARNHGWEILGIRDGFDGLLHPENYPDGGLIKLTRPTRSQHRASRRHHSGHEQLRQSIQTARAAAGWFFQGN